MVSFLSKIIKFNRLLLIGIQKGEDGIMYYTLTVKKKGNNLVVLSSGRYDDLDALLKTADAKLPVILQVDGKGILSKRIDLKNEADLTWKKNIDFNTLYFTEYKVDTLSFLSFSRRNNIDEIIATLQQSKFQIVDLYIGPLLSALIAPNVGSNEIVSGDSVLIFDNGSLAEIKKQNGASTQTYTFSETTLSQYHLPLYGAAVSFFLSPEEIAKNESDKISTEEIIYQKSFNYFGIAMLGTFLIALLTSYLLIQYYIGENSKLNQENLYTNRTYEYITTLEKERKQKIEILEKTGQLSKNFLSFYVYELTRSAPRGINLDNLEVFPLSKEIKVNEKVNLTPNSILLKGTTASDSSFDDWLTQLKGMKWIKKFEVISMKKDKKNIQQFELKIILSNV